MKIIAGKYRGRKLFSQDTNTTRPILGRIRENLFNILNNYLKYEDKIVLDLFAGSGSLGLEALSRNVKFCYFNDYDVKALGFIKKNLHNLKVSPKEYQITKFSYLKCLTFLEKNNIKLDLIFICPPYKEVDYYHEAINLILQKNILNIYGIIILESNILLEIKHEHLVLIKQRKYSHVYLYFFQYKTKE